MKMNQAIEDVQGAEAMLATELQAVGERHAVEHDIYHLTRTLARQCARRVGQLTQFAEHYGARPPPDNITESPGLLSMARHKMAEVIGRSESPALALLRDLRHLYVAAQEAEIAWVILGQAAQAVRDAALLDVAHTGREQAETCGKWVRTRIKESSPQILAAG